MCVYLRVMAGYCLHEQRLQYKEQLFSFLTHRVMSRLRDLRRLCIGNVKYVSSLKPLSELQHLEELVILCSHLVSIC